MRRFTIIGEGGEKLGEQTADFLSFTEGDIVEFVADTDGHEQVIAVSRVWSTITSEQAAPEAKLWVLDTDNMVHVDADTGEETAEMAALRDTAFTSSGKIVVADDTAELVAAAHAAEPAETGVADDPPPAPVKTVAEKAKTAKKGPTVAEAEAEARKRALALQTSGPDAPGVTEEDLTPDPGVQDDAVANPPATPAAGSTGDDHPSAAAGEADGDSTLRVALSTYMANNGGRTEEYVAWLWSAQIPTAITKQTTEQLEQSVAWWSDSREGDDG